MNPLSITIIDLKSNAFTGLDNISFKITKKFSLCFRKVNYNNNSLYYNLFADKFKTDIKSMNE